MRIAQVSPLAESVPPRMYGGTERVVSNLTEQLVAMGHKVTLFASGDSVTRARLIAPVDRALRLERTPRDPAACNLLLLEEVFSRTEEFDIAHFHIDYLHFPLARRSQLPTVTTMHGRLDVPDLVPVFNEFAEVPVVSISDSQREPLPWLNWAGTVYHGLPRGQHRLYPRPGEYLAFLGRISVEKRVDLAIEIAQRAGYPLRIAAKVDPADREYFERRIRPLLDSPGVEFLGEIDEDAKDEFLGNALALLFPIDWPEPFGLVMIESMACGTPVIAFRRGSVPEVMQDGVTGFVVDNVAQAVEAVQQVRSLSRRACRDAFERRFTVDRMARDYLHVYQEVIANHGHARATPAGRGLSAR